VFDNGLGAVKYSGFVYAVIEADFDALEIIGKLRDEVKQLPSNWVAEQDDPKPLESQWADLSWLINVIVQSTAAKAIEPAVLDAVTSAFGNAANEYQRTLAVTAGGPADLNTLIERAIFTDKALARLTEASARLRTLGSGRACLSPGAAPPRRCVEPGSSSETLRGVDPALSHRRLALEHLQLALELRDRPGDLGPAAILDGPAVVGHAGDRAVPLRLQRLEASFEFGDGGHGLEASFRHRPSRHRDRHLEKAEVYKAALLPCIQGPLTRRAGGLG
jgi:hypothetical protein